MIGKDEVTSFLFFKNLLLASPISILVKRQGGQQYFKLLSSLSFTGEVISFSFQDGTYGNQTFQEFLLHPCQSQRQHVPL